MIFIESKYENEFRKLLNIVIENTMTNKEKLPMVKYQSRANWDSIDRLLRILGTRTKKYAGIHLYASKNNT
jgi:hypothetical protein